MAESDERNRLSGRVRRYARVSTNVGGLAARFAGSRLLGLDLDRGRHASELTAALGGLKGPLMKVAQLLATIPEALPDEYAGELATLQSNAPPMGWPFVRRRMSAELGPDWQSRFAEFGRDAVAAASLGQVHRAVAHDGRALAVKLQYPEMASAVEADLRQLSVILAIFRRMDGAIDPSQIGAEIGMRLREELDYGLERRHMRLYRLMLADVPEVTVPEPVEELSTGRLLTMEWLDGKPVLDFTDAPQEVRNRIALAMFKAWWRPFSGFGAIHGDPHLGNYTVRDDNGLNLLDFGCIRTFPPEFVRGVVDLYSAMRDGDRDLAVHAYETWGFRNLTVEMVDALNIWARFIYGPMLEDRVRTIADGVSPGQYGRAEAQEVHGRLRRLGKITPPREFVFMDRAAIGLGAVFLRLGAELNWHRLFNEMIAGFDTGQLAENQRRAFAAADVPLPQPAGNPL